ncbi:hypothetical protein SeLEV6574_g02888 [Synchytrium endobioticum]|uniref:Uncharacterized protein n=1 Tax=Synchytrium endobioticum TaxID=286115 RepID=A0A507D6C6_9FUNG|nr:hypothetical protein SeLEV6574_g02888 [Synchytrium endobioticum]
MRLQPDPLGPKIKENKPTFQLHSRRSKATTAQISLAKSFLNMKWWPFTGSSTVASRAYGTEYDFFKDRRTSYTNPPASRSGRQTSNTRRRGASQPPVVRSDEIRANSPNTAIATAATDAPVEMPSSGMGMGGTTAQQNQVGGSGTPTGLSLQQQQMQYQMATQPQQHRRNRLPPQQTTTTLPPPIPSTASKPSSSKRASALLGTTSQVDPNAPIVATSPLGTNTPSVTTEAGNHGSATEMGLPEDTDARNRLYSIESHIKQINDHLSSLRSKHEKLDAAIDKLMGKIKESQGVGGNWEIGIGDMKTNAAADVGKGKAKDAMGVGEEGMIMPVVAKFIQRQKELHQLLEEKTSYPVSSAPIVHIKFIQSMAGAFRTVRALLLSCIVRPKIVGLLALAVLAGLVVMMPYMTMDGSRAGDDAILVAEPIGKSNENVVIEKASRSHPTPTPSRSPSSLTSPGPLYSTCPTTSVPIYPYRLSDFEAIEQATQYTCADVASSDPKFSILHCKHVTACGVGRFDIKRRDASYCREAMEMVLSTYEAQDEYFKREIGPDTFHVHAAGPQIYVSVAYRHGGNCEYVYHYHLVNPGRVRWTITHLYQDFQATNEVYFAWPELLNTTILENYYHDVCSNCSTISDAGRDAIKFDFPSTVEPAITSRLPYCDSGPNQTITGAWMPFGCKLHALPGGDECLNRTDVKIWFVGDSHTRNTWIGFSRVITKDKTFFNPGDGIADPGSNIWHAGFKVAAHWRGPGDGHMANYLKLSESEFQEYDVIVFNTGQWPASGTEGYGQWSTRRYMNLLKLVVETAVERRARRPKAAPLKLIWLETVAFRIRNDHWVRDYEDWRTTPRIRYWNDLARDMMKKYDVTVIETFSQTLPMFYQQLDDAHFHGTDAMQAILSLLFHELNLCST